MTIITIPHEETGIPAMAININKKLYDLALNQSIYGNE